jgi:hypothetical protein
VKPKQASKVKSRMPTRPAIGEGRTDREVIDMCNRANTRPEVSREVLSEVSPHSCGVANSCDRGLDRRAMARVLGGLAAISCSAVPTSPLANAAGCN